MRGLSVLAWAFAAGTTIAIALEETTEAPPATVAIGIQRNEHPIGPAQRDQLRKRNTLGLNLDNEGTLYFANISIGTPGQSLRLAIDTGSSDIWTNTGSSQLCTQYSRECAISGTYNVNKSSTYSYSNSAFQIKYADGSTAQGDYATDTISLDGTSIDGVTFGIGYSSSSAQGILGIGYAANEASVSTIGKTYSNLPQVLVSKKFINTPAYSLWLNDLDANTGSILFGGVDTAKYNGNLATLPIIKEDGAYREFIIALTGVTAGGQTILTSSNAVPVLLDSGSSLSYLPTTYARAIFTVFNAQYSSQAGAAVVSCSLMNNPGTVDFTFSGVKISVPLNELVLVESIRNGRQTCILGISDAAGGTSVLGDTFLRSAYVVYDLSNNQISLASTNFNATDSSVKEISSGSSGVPGASLVPNAVTSLAVSTGGARGPSVTGIANAASHSTAVNGMLWMGSIVALGMVAGAALLL